MCFFQALIQKAHTFAVHFGCENVSFANFADHGRNYLRPGGLVKHFYSVKVKNHDFSVKAEVDGSVFWALLYCKSENSGYKRQKLLELQAEIGK